MVKHAEFWGVFSAGMVLLGCGSGSSTGTEPDQTQASVVIVQGLSQSGLTGQALRTELRIVVRNEAGGPLTGVPVSWVVTAGGGIVSGETITNSSGQAAASWTLGAQAGQNTVEARVTGASPARFSAIAVDPQTALGLEVMLSTDSRPTEVVLVNPDGSGFVNLTRHPADDGEPAWSPDRSKIAFKSDRDAAPGTQLEYDLYVMNQDGSGVTRLTNVPGRDVEADWSPDGSRIAFSSLRDENFEIYVMNADGSNQIRLTNDPGSDENPDWSPDGTRILFATTRFSLLGAREIAVMNADGTGVTRLTDDTGDDDEPAWSPDGTRIAFSTDRFSPGVYEVATMRADGSGVTRLAAHPGSRNDYAPSWSPDGTKLAYTCWRLRGAEVYSEVCSMNADGTGETRLTMPLVWASWPAWRP